MEHSVGRPWPISCGRARILDVAVNSSHCLPRRCTEADRSTISLYLRLRVNSPPWPVAQGCTRRIMTHSWSSPLHVCVDSLRLTSIGSNFAKAPQLLDHTSDMSMAG